MAPVDTFEELRSFWREAYASLNPQPHQQLQPALEQWASSVLTADGAPPGSPIRSLFSLKPPEPFFGKWRTDERRFGVDGKTIVVLINPGDGIGFAHCATPEISMVGRPHWALLKEFYTTGSIVH
ncbi:hypothetical protein [Sorangium cellulosum]|uniref:hypothetical protein n=1 Tax=Sorangium cellulosum TaxID=56 RepID=UPI001010C2EA|nr:hypothetical protein [Sorangium cellulosum]